MGRVAGTHARTMIGPSDYARIRRQREEDYGKKVHKFGDLSQKQYAEPAHFLLELLQNTEDALARRSPGAPVCERGVSFDLKSDSLTLSHFGDPFTSADVESICDFDESTKGREGIGRFGLGFKSVYAFTDRPEIHSGLEDFVIRNYVWPEAATPVDRGSHQTVIVLPRDAGSANWASLQDELPRMLSGRHLLFLRHIESVHWSAPGGLKGQCLRHAEKVDDGVRRVTLIGDSAGTGSGRDEEWLIFDRTVSYEDRAAGRVEIAFGTDSEAWSAGEEFPIRSVAKSPLYAFFPTVIETHLGFHVQGPYNTTPARNDVRWPDCWNEYLVSETALLLRSALRWIRNRDAVRVALLKCLPLNEPHFTQTMFWPLFEATRNALRDDGLLPTDSKSFARASQARLGRGAELRTLFSSDELADLCGIEEPVHWISGEVTTDQAPMLHAYLQQQLGVEELDPESVVNRLTAAFLERRSDSWIRRFYGFLSDLSGSRIRRLVGRKPVLRLHDGEQVCPPSDDDRRVYFPGDAATGFRTVRGSVCDGEKARKFLANLGVLEPDLVADVEENVLSKYAHGRNPTNPSEYSEDLQRIRTAYTAAFRGGPPPVDQSPQRDSVDLGS